ncbi:unknown [Clostridium sp. CAG:813]|nr:unknown [Clostridium sp. CAG:813]
MSFESITILVFGAVIEAVAFFNTNEFTSISPVKVLVSQINLITASDSNNLTSAGLFNISKVLTFAFISGLSSFNFPFIIVLRDNVPFLMSLSLRIAA